MVVEADDRRGDGEGGGIIDLHSHLVPGVDDGARTLDDVLEGVGRMVERRVERIITTPHLEGSLTLDPPALERRLSRVDAAWTEARAVLQGAHPDLIFERAHEVLLDIPDPDLSDPRLRFPGTSVVLAEWPRLQIPPETPRVLSRLRKDGIRILLAHPERYRGFDPDLSLVAAWRAEGAWLQMNHGSLMGRYGSPVRQRALQLLSKGAVDCLSSDFHGRAHLRLYIREAESLFLKAGAHEAWRLLVSENPRRLCRGEEPLPVPPVVFPEGMADRIRSFLGGRGQGSRRNR